MKVAIERRDGRRVGRGEVLEVEVVRAVDVGLLELGQQEREAGMVEPVAVADGRAHRHDVAGGVVRLHRDADLLEVVLALRRPAGLAGHLDGGEQQGDQHRDDGDDDQQLDQREGSTAHRDPLRRGPPALRATGPGAAAEGGGLLPSILGDGRTKETGHRPPRILPKSFRQGQVQHAPCHLRRPARRSPRASGRPARRRRTRGSRRRRGRSSGRSRGPRSGRPRPAGGPSGSSRIRSRRTRSGRRWSIIEVSISQAWPIALRGPSQSAASSAGGEVPVGRAGQDRAGNARSSRRSATRSGSMFPPWPFRIRTRRKPSRSRGVSSSTSICS